MIEIRETRTEDLKNVQRLWADGDVMCFVGYPNGLHETDDAMQKWIRWIKSSRPSVNHYSIFEDGTYCGEAFYEIDKSHDNSAAMDIKLFDFARGRGIATKALSYAVNEAFKNGAKNVWVDPVPEKIKAIKLYERLGFTRKNKPAHLTLQSQTPSSIYMELRKQ